MRTATTSREIERDAGRVVDLDVIVCERRAGVAAAAVKLADDEDGPPAAVAAEQSN
jgi:hypothetical protein